MQAGWEGNHVETVVGDQHLARQLAAWLMRDPTVDRLDELRNAVDPRFHRPAADRAADAQAWGVRHDPLWLTHWRTPDDLVRAWRQATGRDPGFNADLAAARATAAATDPDWYRQWWHRHSDAPTPGVRHLAELDIIRRYGPNTTRSDPDTTPTADADPQQARADAAASSQAATDGSTSTDGQASPSRGETEFDQARTWARAHDPTWYDGWSADYDWADTRDGRRSLENQLLSRWRRRDTTDTATTNAGNDIGRTPMTEAQAAILTNAGRQPNPGLTWVEASLLIDEVHGTPPGEKAGQWLRDHGLTDDAADRAIADATAKLYPDPAPPEDAPPAGQDVTDWFRTHDPDYYRQWSAEHAHARDQVRSQRRLEKLWAQLTGHDPAFTADLTAARYQAINNDPDAAHRYHQDRDAAASPTARHELDRQLIQRWHPQHSFRNDNFFHVEPAPTLAHLLRGRVPNHVLDHPRWPTAEDTFANLVERGAQADALADTVAAVDFDNGGIRAPSGYASWLMRETANPTIPEPGSYADHRRLVVEWLADADPANPLNRSLAAQLVGEFDTAFDADIARVFPGILDGDARHHSHYDDHPDTTLMEATSRAFVADADGTVQPEFRTADYILAVDALDRTDILATIDQAFVANTPTRVAYRRPEPEEPEAATDPREPATADDDTLARAAAPLEPPEAQTSGAEPAATNQKHRPSRARKTTSPQHSRTS